MGSEMCIRDRLGSDPMTCLFHPASHPGGRQRSASWYRVIAVPSCLSRLEHCKRRALSRARCTAGRSSAARTPMIAITTSSSIRVKPLRPFTGLCIIGVLHLVKNTRPIPCSLPVLPVPLQRNYGNVLDQGNRICHFPAWEGS